MKGMQPEPSKGWRMLACYGGRILCAEKQVATWQIDGNDF